MTRTREMLGQQRRAPHGARGLKYKKSEGFRHIEASRPTRGAWIEIAGNEYIVHEAPSRPTRGAWIEIAQLILHVTAVLVAPHTGRVD